MKNNILEFIGDVITEIGLFTVGTKLGLILLVSLCLILFMSIISGFSVSLIFGTLIGSCISVSFFFRNNNLKWFKYEQKIRRKEE